MRLALFPALVLAAAGTRGGCVGPSSGYDPCADKACGETCHVCPPADPSCFETADVKACDPDGRCTSGPVTCGVADACAGKACGDDCTWDPPCRMASPPCMMPSYLGHCDPSGACLSVNPPPPGFCLPPVSDCADQACGTPCQAPCPYGAPCPAPGTCDGNGACVSPLGLLCPPTSYDPCAGKACHEACSPCAPGVPCPMYAIATWCDGAGACVPNGSGAACP